LVHREINQGVLLFISKGHPVFPALIHRAGDHPSRFRLGQQKMP
jgi:hypothetical protein